MHNILIFKLTIGDRRTDLEDGDLRFTSAMAFSRVHLFIFVVPLRALSLQIIPIILVTKPRELMFSFASTLRLSMLAKVFGIFSSGCLLIYWSSIY